MKQRYYQLEASWDDLFSASVGCVSRLLPGCDRLDRLVHTVNGIARATESLNAGCVDMLDECRETFMWLIPRCSKIGYLVNAARCIARVMKRFGLDWSSLLDECRIRLMQLLPECEECRSLPQHGDAVKSHDTACYAKGRLQWAVSVAKRAGIKNAVRPRAATAFL